MMNISTQYCGYKVITDSNPLLPEMYTTKDQNYFALEENQYLLVLDQYGNPVDRLKWQDGKYKNIFKKPLDSAQIGKVKAKNPQQELAIDMLMDETTTVKVLTGTWGSGKTFLACSAAWQMIQAGKFDKIVWVRNNIEVRDTNPIGALPGTYLEKMSVWAMPLADHLGGKDELDHQIQMGKVEIEHLGFLRGRDIRNAIIFCSEAEHLTTDHVKLLLGRVAEGSILILEGDCRQVDAKVFEKDNGLVTAIEKLKGNRLVAYVHLQETVRSATARLADLLDKEGN